ncbi:GntR family transcriptional regulator [Marinomonas ushuaiensis DSM 15871]|uniref:GntR family transcriptional regulator n=1 Tax=Marinomonas ushuaiensis DSM 15871 TaxID=1122207 RepID=X7E8Q3_9GAMM|nr:FadR/GntR family transcriptional regulator [Marinomonas ushuaiensis]ETX12429.1 GntR family transcriptional regulator [Marinomonas ushuaiensis DSM 15871]
MKSIDNPHSFLQVQRVGQSDNLGTVVARQVESEITSGRISVGEKLPTENALCDLFGVSRTVIREAITQLKSLGLVETKRGVGTAVIRSMSSESVFAYNVDPTAIKDILDILEIRMSVEGAACALAAERRTEEDLAEIEHHFTEFDLALERGELARKQDYNLHLAICQATHNPFFKQFFEQFNKNVIPRAKLINTDLDQVASEEYLARVRAEHEAIVVNIRNQDTNAAQKAMNQHLSHAHSLYKRYKNSNSFD